MPVAIINAQSLRYQINLRILLSIAILLLCGGSTAIWQARHSVREEVQASVNLALQLIELGLAQTRETPAQSSDWLRKIVSLKATRHLNIQIQSSSGQTLSFSSHDRQVKQPLPPRWFVSAVAADYPQAAYEVPGADGKPVKILIQANPLDEITEAWEETRGFVISIALLATVIFLAVNLVLNKALKPVAIILESLKDIENGDYQKQLPLFSTHEFTTIAKALNHMIAALDNARRENSALALHSLEIQEEKRQHLSQELHDEFGQSLAAIKVMAVAAKQPGAEYEKIGASIASICDHLFGVLRSMMRNLHPITLTELGLRATLDDLADQWALRNPELQLRIRCAESVDRLEGKKAIQLFRVIQECLTNTVRHAQARLVTVDLDVVDELVTSIVSRGMIVRLTVQDDGQGCDLQTIRGGFGLLGMRERITNLGGQLTIQSQPGQGMRIEACIPCPCVVEAIP